MLNKVDISDYKNVNSVNFRRLPKNNERIYDQKILDKTMVPGLNLRLWPRGGDKVHCELSYNSEKRMRRS